jgi:hypothetical protein
MTNLPNYQDATCKSFWAGLRKTRKLIEETDRIVKENGLQMKENGLQMKEQIQETERLRRESDAKFEKYREDYEKRQKKIDELLGSWDNNHGAFAEEYFFNSFEKGEQNFFGERFDEIEKNMKPKKRNNIQDEYDIVMTNGSSVAIVETKFTAHVNDINRIQKKAETFKILCPEYKDYKIYLGLASLSFYPLLEEACKANGIAIIKQVGENVVIYDEWLKVY